MKRWIIITILVMQQSLMADETSDELQNARNKGADARIILRCVDQYGGVVTNATVSTALYPDGSFVNAIIHNGITDTNGIFKMEGKTNGEFTYSLSKSGHYKTREQKFLFELPNCSIKDGRWQPYGMTNTVVLKRCVNPVAMCVKSNRDGILSPVTNEYVGYDLKKGDWVSPHGKGVVADISIKYEYEAGTVPQLYYRGVVSFAFTNRFDGAYVMKKEAFSTFMSVYNANINNAYQQELIFAYDRLSGKCKEDTRLPDSDYLVLRTRSKRDKDGNLISANYAKIYGPIAAGRGGIYFGFYFNPNENDPNLEADPTKNLLNPNDFGFAP